MPNFERHLRFGLALHGALAALATLGYLLALLPASAVAVVAVGLPVTAAGAVAPDLDHPDSRPFGWVKRYAPPAAAAGWVAALARGHETLTALVAPVPLALPSSYVAGGLTVATALWIHRWTARLVPLVRPSHRTVLHRPTAAAVTAVVPVGATVLAVRSLDTGAARPRLAGALCAGWYVCGYLGHLYLDGELPRVGGSAD